MQEFHIKTIIFLIISLSIEIILLVICKTHQLDLYETYKVLMFDGCTCTAVYVVKYRIIKLDTFLSVDQVFKKYLQLPQCSFPL